MAGWIFIEQSASRIGTTKTVTATQNAWLIARVLLVEATGRKTLVIAGVWTSVCVVFPALQAKADGYEVFVVMDAPGDVSKMASDAALARMTAAGIITVTTNTILSETHRTWNRPDAAKWGELYSELVPEYRSAVESYTGAQKAASQGK